MKKAFFSVSLLVIFIAAVIIGFIGSLKTEYGAPAVNYLLNDVLAQNIRVASVDVQMPYHITLHGVELSRDSSPEQPNPDGYYIEQVDLWLNTNSFWKQKLIIDSLLFNGLSLQHGMSFSPQQFIAKHNIQLNQLAINNLDFANDTFSSRGVNLQATNPQWLTQEQLLPFSKLQLSAEQVYWNGEALDNLLIDLDFKPKDSTLYGLSFKWRESSVSGQAEQFNQDWSLINVTLDNLVLDTAQIKEIADKHWNTQAFTINHINSLDIIHSDLEWQQWHLSGLNASLENIQLPFQIWQQQQGKLSMQADSINGYGQQWVDPNISLELAPQEMTVIDLTTLWQQGQIQLAGQFTPSSINLSSLYLHGIKWSIEKRDLDALQVQNHQTKQAVSQWLNNLNEFSIEKLDVERSQLIQLAQQPFWQASGVNIEGEELSLLSNGKAGLWQGTLMVSANNASYGQILSSHPLIEMNSQQGHWQLTRLFAPLSDGYIEAQASLDFKALSQPWQLFVNADGIPVAPLISNLGLPFELEGLSEFELKASGLLGDSQMLAHSLTGEITGSIRNSGLATKVMADDVNQDKKLTAKDFQPISISDLNVAMDRGRIVFEKVQLSGEELTGEIEGKLDLTQPEQHVMSLKLKKQCKNISGDIFTGKYSVNTECNAEKVIQPVLKNTDNLH